MGEETYTVEFYLTDFCRFLEAVKTGGLSRESGVRSRFVEAVPSELTIKESASLRVCESGVTARRLLPLLEDC